MASPNDAQLETISAMITEAKELRLNKRHQHIINRFVAIESDLYYSFSHNSAGYLLLPSSEDSLFVSPLELAMEPCLERRFEFGEVMADSPAAQNEQSSGSTGRTDGESSCEGSTATNFRRETPHIFAKSRNPNEVRLHMQPLAFFSMWYTSLKASYDGGKDENP
ncbi:hypothetical protein GMRT_12712 [Giardia muris]|uniref:Uncharacterized protein n=1 Tax=Giardia muris TaxID=5742 RepID=A0A4Z1SYH1_GIAMU|nr:hypothetical protein GMRT_12712 [Giardia muris]|eukprot:TNJ28548.1 hypothetical protein GMRT_12712 [Giardia muris]